MLHDPAEFQSRIWARYLAAVFVSYGSQIKTWLVSRN
jgi:hypothetical protein